MEEIRLEQPIAMIENAAGRRSALRILGAGGAALLAALGLPSSGAGAETPTKRGTVQGERKKKGKKKRRQSKSTAPTTTQVFGAPVAIADGQIGTLVAPCAAGVPIAGGATSIGGEKCFIFNSARNDTLNAWATVVNCPAGSGGGQFTPVAICLS